MLQMESERVRLTIEGVQTEYERCEMCGQPIAGGKIPPGPYAPFYIQCRNKRRGASCNHRNWFPRK